MAAIERQPKPMAAGAPASPRSSRQPSDKPGAGSCLHGRPVPADYGQRHCAGPSTWLLRTSKPIVGPDGRLTYAELAAEVAQAARSALHRHPACRRVTTSASVIGNGTRWLAAVPGHRLPRAPSPSPSTRGSSTEELRYCSRPVARDQPAVPGRQACWAATFGAMIRLPLPLAIETGTRLPDPALPDLAEAGRHRWTAIRPRGRRCRGTAFLAHVPPTWYEPLLQALTDVLLIQYTSGTTSFPKGVMLPHRNMLANAFRRRRAHGAAHRRPLSQRPPVLPRRRHHAVRS